MRRFIKKQIFTNCTWLMSINDYFDNLYRLQGYNEVIGAKLILDPFKSQIASKKVSVFNPEKAAAMYFWYKKGDREDLSIIDYFPEYEHCIDYKHKMFNSNYGYYANKGLKQCAEVLLKQKNTRQACFLINNNLAMGPNSIDKLCTNAVMFFIRDNTLNMVVQMRSSNLLTLLPYDFFIFSTWYAKMLNSLIAKYDFINIGHILLQIGSLHFYESDYVKKSIYNETHNIEQLFDFKSTKNANFIEHLDYKLIKFL